MNTIEKNLTQIGRKYQEIMETYSDNLSGICYHCAKTLTEYFLLNKHKSKVVVGNLALINNSDKYLVYGDKMHILKEQNIGLYHAWCEVIILDKKYIVDPSIKFNKVFLKKNLKIKLSKNIPNIIVTTKSNYYWKYVENKNLKNEYEYFLNNIPNGIFEVKRIAQELRNKTFDSMLNIDLYNINSL